MRFVLPLLVVASVAAAEGPSRFESLPNHEQYKSVSDAVSEARRSGRVRDITWSDDGLELRYRADGTWWVLDLETAEVSEDEVDAPAEGDRSRRRVRRGHQADRAESPDGAWVAVCRDWNVVIEPKTEGDESPDEDEVIQVTTDGTRKNRYGKASWVYGEELRQTTAMWWSPDSSKLVFYALDESGVSDYHLSRGLTDLRPELETEGYPKPGEANPIARLMVFDLASLQVSPIDVGPRTEQYVFNIRFAPDGTLLFSRTNRHQNVLEIVAVDLDDLEPRVIVTETQRTWQRNRPTMRFLDDGRRFIWETEKTGYRHYELRDLDGRLHNRLTRGDWPCVSIALVDEANEHLYFTAYSEANPLNAHLHRVGLDGSGLLQLTSDGLNHQAWVSPDGRWFVASAETSDIPPTTALYSTDGQRIATLAEHDTTLLEPLGLTPPELFSFTAADGVTTLYGLLFKPADFDTRRQYPLLIDVYGGPQSKRVWNRYRPADANCERGFVMAIIDNRGTRDRGKAFEDAVYLRCGDVDLADQVAGVRHLLKRPYLDGRRVGIFGRSYGGYMAALAILKYPDVFHAAVAGAPVTDWRNYDTIYTERYMRTPEENPSGYEDGSCITHAERLRGHLLIMHGMVDDNVHANNAWQLVQALHDADKRFEMVFFPDAAHGLAPAARTYQWEFLCDKLLAPIAR